WNDPEHGMPTGRRVLKQKPPDVSKRRSPGPRMCPNLRSPRCSPGCTPNRLSPWLNRLVRPRMAEVNLAQALNSALDDALAGDDRVVLLGEDIGRTGGVFRITDGLREKHGADRVYDTPVAESGIIGAAFGMAIAGFRPV